MKILSLTDITERIDLSKIIALQTEGFLAYSQGKVNMPPVGYIKVDHTGVSYHLKYGVIQGDTIFVVKLAGGLEHTTPEFGPGKMYGMMIVIDAKNGVPLYLLQDEGYLTQLRTAVAGLIAVKYLAPPTIHSIGVLGTGAQAFLQVKLLKEYTSCRAVWVWGRNSERINFLKKRLEEENFTVFTAKTPAEIAQNCNVIVTTTASNTPLLTASDIQAGTHITAVGADAPGKQELDPYIFQKADIIVTDSKSQCIDHGEIFSAYSKKIVQDHQILELGQIIANPLLGRLEENQITVIDLTGIAVQDIQIAKAIIY